MDLQTIKLDLINWLVNLKDEATISSIQSIKDKDSVDQVLEDNEQLKQLLDNRLEEKTEDFVDARASLNAIKAQYEL